MALSIKLSDAFDTIQFGQFMCMIQHDSIILTQSLAQGFDLFLGRFLDNSEGQFENFKHILIFKGTKYTIYQCSCHHCTAGSL